MSCRRRPLAAVHLSPKAIYQVLWVAINDAKRSFGEREGGKFLKWDSALTLHDEHRTERDKSKCVTPTLIGI